MNIFRNKYFVLGNLAFLLIVIPVVLFFVKNQTTTRSGAVATTNLSFQPNTITTNQCDNTKTANLVLDPGQNLVNQVILSLKWDTTKFDIDFVPNSTAFPNIVRTAEKTSTGMTISLDIGGDITKAINTTTNVGTATIKPLTSTGGSAVKLEVDPINTIIYSLSTQDGTLENVFNSATPLDITLTAQSCNIDNITPTVTVTGTISPSPTRSINPTPTTTSSSPSPSPTPTTRTSLPTSTPTTAPNQAPACVSLVSSASTGTAPFSVTLTVNGRDTDGTVAKTTFNFGDGSQQDVTTGMGTTTVNAQIAHTYSTSGTFTATAVFTDNRGALSAACSAQIAVSAAAPTAIPTSAILPTNTPTRTPTIAQSGSVVQTIGVVGGVVLVIIAGIFLLVL